MRRHLRFILLATACAAASLYAGTEPVLAQKASSKKAAERAAIEKTLQANEQKLNDAVMKGDAGAFKALVDADGMSADQNGFLSVADFEKQLKAGGVKITGSKLAFSKVIWIDGDNAVVTYTWTGQGTFMNKPVQSPVYASTLWTNHKGKWVAAFHQETPAQPGK